jgi:hypothetical protein
MAQSIIAGDYVIWAEVKINMGKSGIRAVDIGTGQSVPTDCDTLNGVPFPVNLPDQPYEHLGVRGTMMGDFSAEKQHLLGDLVKKLEALREDRLLTRKEKEQVIVIAVCSVFNCSAGIVYLTKAELDHMSTVWACAYKQAWALPRTAYGYPLISDQSHGGTAEAVHQPSELCSRCLISRPTCRCQSQAGLSLWQRASLRTA